jgi:hypothetical protein
VWKSRPNLIVDSLSANNFILLHFTCTRSMISDFALKMGIDKAEAAVKVATVDG